MLKSGWLETQITGQHGSQINPGHYGSIMFYQQKLTYDLRDGDLK